MYAWVDKNIWAEWAAYHKRYLDDEVTIQDFLREIGTPALMGHFDADAYNAPNQEGMWHRITEGAYVKYNQQYQKTYQSFVESIEGVEIPEEEPEDSGVFFSSLKRYFSFIQNFIA